MVARRISQSWQYQDYQYCVSDPPSAHRPRKTPSPLVHPDMQKNRTAANKQSKVASTLKQLSSIKDKEGQVQSNLSALEASSPQQSQRLSQNSIHEKSQKDKK